MTQTSSETTETKNASASPAVETSTQTLPAQNKKNEKVELDIEDAPFLKEEAKQESAESEAESVEETKADDDLAKKKKKKKLMIIAGGAVLLLVLGAGAAWFLLKGSPAPPPPSIEETKPEVIVVPSKKGNAVAPDLVKDFDRFVVPVGETLSTTNFLICKFSTVTKNPGLENELDQKMILLRDSVYFYLRSKSYDFLLDPNNAEEIKKDLVAILNDYLSTGKLSDVLLDTYLGH